MLDWFRRCAPDRWGRVEGTSYRPDRAPDGAVPLRERLFRPVAVLATLVMDWAPARGAQLLRPQPGDVLVLRFDVDNTARAATIARQLAEAQLAGKLPRNLAIVLLPADVLVHVEPGKLKREDRGYRETATYGADKRDDTNADARGVHTGLPGRLTPHPQSESGDDDPRARR